MTAMVTVIILLLTGNDFSGTVLFSCIFQAGNGFSVKTAQVIEFFLRENINCPEKGAGAALSCLAWSEPGQSCQVPDSSDLT